MIKIAKHLVFLLPVLFSLGANAQGQTSGQSLDQLKYVIPPSPDASSLGKFADWPTNLYTGLPNIDIPIYELAGRTATARIAHILCAHVCQMAFDVPQAVRAPIPANADGAGVRGLALDGGRLQWH